MRYRLTEAEFHKFIEESVKAALDEISMNTVDSAIEQSYKKMQNANSEAARNQAYKQHNSLTKERSRRMGYNPYVSQEANKDSNIAKQARWEKNNKDRRSGELRYEKGKGWKHGNQPFF